MLYAVIREKFISWWQLIANSKDIVFIAQTNKIK